VTLRVAGPAVLVVMVAWLLTAVPGGWRRRLLAGTVAALAGAAIAVGYAAANNHHTGYFVFTRNHSTQSAPGDTARVSAVLS
jgi:hypothetical protein